ncbi:MAG: acetyl-CoA carboxylase biotin carboxyl carrier protein subunit [Dermatophilaceae bacterium]
MSDVNDAGRGATGEMAGGAATAGAAEAGTGGTAGAGTAGTAEAGTGGAGTAGVGPASVPGGAGAGHGALDELRAAAKALTADLPGPLARIRLSRGEATLEVEWQAPPAPLAPVVVAAPVTGPVGMPTIAGSPSSPGTPASPGTPVSLGGGEPDAGGGGTAYAMSAGPALSVVPDLPIGTPVEAPLVGTFYRSSSPDAAPFVEVGDRVEEGQQIAILEAMKLLNSIEAPVCGTVAEILVRNGEMVEFGQVLLTIQEG